MYPKISISLVKTSFKKVKIISISLYGLMLTKVTISPRKSDKTPTYFPIKTWISPEKLRKTQGVKIRTLLILQPAIYCL